MDWFEAGGPLKVIWFSVTKKKIGLNANDGEGVPGRYAFFGMKVVVATNIKS